MVDSLITQIRDILREISEQFNYGILSGGTLRSLLSLDSNEITCFAICFVSASTSQKHLVT